MAAFRKIPQVRYYGQKQRHAPNSSSYTAYAPEIYQHWTAAEDEVLLRGVQKHGRSWVLHSSRAFFPLLPQTYSGQLVERLWIYYHTWGARYVYMNDTNARPNIYGPKAEIPPQLTDPVLSSRADVQSPRQRER